MDDQATPSQRVVGSTPTRRTNFRRPPPCRPAEEARSRDQTTGLVNGNLEHGAALRAVAGDDEVVALQGLRLGPLIRPPASEKWNII